MKNSFTARFLPFSVTAEESEFDVNIEKACAIDNAENITQKKHIIYKKPR
jgi:hypothetical protein